MIAHRRSIADIRALGLVISWLLLAATAAPLVGQTIQARRSGDFLLVSAAGAATVEDAAGERLALPLGDGARISDFRTVGDGWFLAAVRGTTIEILRGGREIEALPSPILEPAREIAKPLDVTDGSEVRALVWLAGSAHDTMAVWAAGFTGGGWAAPTVISPPGPGTQIALTAAVLGDDAWLVAWAAYDGEDDEILWSRWDGGAWSVPRPVAEDNRVPDITPQLYPVAGGALAVWSRYDGNDYRLNAARFDGTGWSEARVIGPRGSTFPNFSDLGRPYLTHHLADPPGWAVMELDAAGRVVREAAVESKDPRRPVLGEVAAREVVLEWAGREKQAANHVALRWTAR